MMKLWTTLSEDILFFMVEVTLFLCLVLLGSFIYKKIENSNSRYLNPLEFLPDDEIFTLKQVLYLIVMAACFTDVIYTLISPVGEIFYLAVGDIILSLYLAIQLKDISAKNILIFFCLIPFGSLTVFLSNYSLLMFLDIMHIAILIYFIKVNFDKFMEYTHSNGLGITILLLFLIVFFSFLFTIVNEGVSALDSLVMVSNAFTSNGYAVLGSSIIGKVNSIFLVWGGYIISGAGTATLTAAILIKRFNKRFRELERLIEEGSDENG